jgi:hypothetical protein
VEYQLGSEQKEEAKYEPPHLPLFYLRADFIYLVLEAAMNGE